MLILAMLPFPVPVSGVAEGIVDWPHAGALVLWFLVVALVGSLLGLLKERADGRLPSNGPATPKPAPKVSRLGSDRHLRDAA